MLPCIIGGHAAYQDFVLSQIFHFYPDPFSISKDSWETIIEFWHLDLSLTDSLMMNRYSRLGPEPRLPSCMLRSYLLSIKFKITSITRWAALLKENPLYAILSGFSFGDVPGIGTFYDFFSRLWDSDSDNLSPKERFLKPKTKKGIKKGDKTPADTDSISSRLLPFFQRHPVKPSHAFSFIFRLYHTQFLDISIKNGLINPAKLSVAGDGTPVKTSSLLRKKQICKCKKNGISDCNCKRFFSQPDTNSGWDSSRECYFNGYHLFMFVASDSFSDLPVFPLLERASRHDMLSFLHTFFSMKAYLPDFHLEKLLLDSAMDAIPVYEYCKTAGITPFIDLSKTNNGNYKYKDTFTIDPDGVPRCRLGLRMHHDGYESKKNRCKYRCPKANRKKGCFCETPCSPAKYGRTVHTQLKDNPRMFNIPPRDSKEWDKEYGRRTSVERSNKREKQDYKLEDGKHRSTKMWYCRLYGIMMCQHLDAWNMPSVEDFQNAIQAA
ncbi:hypothetical protein LI031_30945 [Enterocloster citroniae]|uniref:hypothetical protein n=1 Tax=Enterocloster citroniae TaxID=358743 RepID=UPI001D05E3F1|nr:hypothetical protein [Enterocloster citroniae]MCB7068257.1 hypothetical protein [Enterocloster citroniae]